VDVNARSHVQPGSHTPAGVRAALARPAFYPHRPARVEVHETHISWVFLAGERAYKLKKPLVLPFLDYGTPQRRHEACREEARLNRRLAGDLYLGVRAVAAGPDGLVLAAEDAPQALDYLVEMRRYDERATLAAKLERSELREAEVAELARKLARFHARARVIEGAEASTSALRTRVGDNFRELLALLERGAALAAVLGLERFTDAFIAAEMPMLDRRARAGLVREGHGDLRAEHVLLDGDVRVVDCIEFSPAFRRLDVADELAFLVMDLTRLGGERFARVLVRAYRDAGGDPGEDRLIAFYACFRALVRAKVALLRARQSSRSGTARGDETAAAEQLVALAERLAWRARLPLVIVVCGVPASGKSHLARALRAVTGLRRLSSDAVRKRMAGVTPGERAPAAAYSAHWNRLTYAELGRRAAAAVRARGGALVDATFRHRSDREAFAAAFGNAAPVLFVECTAPTAVLAERAAHRGRRARAGSDATLEVVMRERRAWEPLDEVSATNHIILRSDRPAREQIADLVGALDGRVCRL
jgi:aminoglycoside phosphotransferase family enzyme/predicted kinase